MRTFEHPKARTWKDIRVGDIISRNSGVTGEVLKIKPCHGCIRCKSNNFSIKLSDGSYYCFYDSITHQSLWKEFE